VNALLDLVAVAAVVGATVLIGAYGLRISRTTSDFFVASRTVRPVWNASAISGEYLSAGTFLGLSGLVLLSGAEGFWFPIGYAAGYLLVLLFVAAPLRRSGAYTIPDFIEARLESRASRRVTSAACLLIGWLYIVPQLHGAGITLQVDFAHGCTTTSQAWQRHPDCPTCNGAPVVAGRGERDALTDEHMRR